MENSKVYITEFSGTRYIDKNILAGFVERLFLAEPNPNWSGDASDLGTNKTPWRVYNIGNNSPVKLMDYIAALEKDLCMKAEMELLPLEPGDVPDTNADVADLMRDFEYRPNTPVEEQGVANFVAWYREYFKVKS